jgi:hypothetical protein
MTPDGLGGLHIADTLNNRIRRVLPTSPSYDAAPSTFNFNASAGGSVTPPQSIQISSTVTGLAFTVALSDPWLNTSLTSGSMPSSVDITVDPSQLAAGPHNGTVTITSLLASAPIRVVTVSVNVAPAEAPQLTVDSPGINFTFV